MRFAIWLLGREVLEVEVGGARDHGDKPPESPGMRGGSGGQFEQSYGFSGARSMDIEGRTDP